MNSIMVYLSYVIVRIVGFIIRQLPMRLALWIGRVIGSVCYVFDVKHKFLAYSNLKTAFAGTKEPNEIRRIIKKVFQNCGQNLIELLRLPLMNSARLEEYVKMEGRNYVEESLKQGKGLILLAMHFGSWELASLSSVLLKKPYKVIVKSQTRFSKLDKLLNSYRTCGGAAVLPRGIGTREMIRTLQNNEIIAMVVDQGGKDGVLVPFFGRQASFSVGAVKLGLKMDVPICFSIIIRGSQGTHRLIIEEPVNLERTGDMKRDVVTNLSKMAKIMEDYIREFPSEYMWFYKIWKYSKETNIVILSDGKTGHLRQAEAVAKMVKKALLEKAIHSSISIRNVCYKNKFGARSLSLLSLFLCRSLLRRRAHFLKAFLTKESYKEIMGFKADFIISCGSSVAGLNYFLSSDHEAQSIVVLKPGLLGCRRFDLTMLPEHDHPPNRTLRENICLTKGAPNLVDQDYLKEQSSRLLDRYSHLKLRAQLRIALLIGGNTHSYVLDGKHIRIAINQIKEVAEAINADILVTTSRRTPAHIESILQREFRKHSRCPLLIIANRNNVPEAVGGILGLSDIIVVSGDSISMISEAASSGKGTVVFPLKEKDKSKLRRDKYGPFIERLNEEGFILSCKVTGIGQAISDLAKNKIKTKVLDDNEVIFNAVRKIV